ncbi:hypothetical protein ACRRTK_005173 [Alexandromys fortis]
MAVAVDSCCTAERVRSKKRVHRMITSDRQLWKKLRAVPTGVFTHHGVRQSPPAADLRPTPTSLSCSPATSLLAAPCLALAASQLLLCCQPQRRRRKNGQELDGLPHAVESITFPPCPGQPETPVRSIHASEERKLGSPRVCLEGLRSCLPADPGLHPYSGSHSMNFIFRSHKNCPFLQAPGLAAELTAAVWLKAEQGRVTCVMGKMVDGQIVFKVTISEKETMFYYRTVNGLQPPIKVMAPGRILMKKWIHLSVQASGYTDQHSHRGAQAQQYEERQLDAMSGESIGK